MVASSCASKSTDANLFVHVGELRCQPRTPRFLRLGSETGRQLSPFQRPTQGSWQHWIVILEGHVGLCLAFLLHLLRAVLLEPLKRLIEVLFSAQNTLALRQSTPCSAGSSCQGLVPAGAPRGRAPCRAGGASRFGPSSRATLCGTARVRPRVRSTPPRTPWPFQPCCQQLAPSDDDSSRSTTSP